LSPISGAVPVSFLADGSDQYSINLVVLCTRLDSALEAWKIKTYRAILAAYQARKDAYDSALADAQAKAANMQSSDVNQLQGTNPALNQTIIQNELKKGCIRWLFNGQDFSNWGMWGYNDANNPPVVGTHPAMVANVERAKFIEQCFEWSLMTYTLYPYFWAGRPQWRQLYQLSDPDPLFLNFLQSGMARALVSVRPGYEKAAMHFLATGEIWNGGDRPGPNSPIYVSIVDELKQPVGTRVGEPWEIRVPSTLTVLQEHSGAIAGKGLPCDCEPEKALGLTDPVVLTGK
jgi:hypothetical protein